MALRFPASPWGKKSPAERSRCRGRDETACFGVFREVSVPGEGRDCGFRRIMRGLGAEGGTRLRVSGDFERSRCRGRDETSGFGGFREVSVPREGRDCGFLGILRGLGVGGGTRPRASQSLGCGEGHFAPGGRGFRLSGVGPTLLHPAAAGSRLSGVGKAFLHPAAAGFRLSGVGKAILHPAADGGQPADDRGPPAESRRRRAADGEQPGKTLSGGQS